MLKNSNIETNSRFPLDIKKEEKILKLTKSHRGKSFHFNKLNPSKQDKGIGSLKNPNLEISEFYNNILKIKKYNYYYLLDRNKYDINQIMMLLDIERIHQIQEIFNEYPQGIEKNIFIKRLKKLISVDEIDLPNLIYGLYKFFSEIDFNGDGHMQWNEFTQFIIDTVEGDEDAKIINDDDDKKVFNEKKMMQYKKYKISKRMKDNNLYKQEIISAVYIPKIDIIIMNEYGKRLLKIYNPITGKNDKILDLESYINPKALKNSKSSKHKKNLTLNDSSNSKSKEKKEEKNTVYSVLYMTRFQSLLALCLSDKRIVFLNFGLDGIIEFIYEIKLPILEKRIWYLKHHNIWVTSGVKLPKYNFYTLNELDIELQYFNQKYDFLYNENRTYRAHYLTKISQHYGEILDCIEIFNPLLILTACLDGKIRLLNIDNINIIKIWSYHKLGVKQLDYNYNLEGGYVLSVGFENYINLYNINISVDDAYKGKLEGSYLPIINCQFISESYLAISVDEEGNIRIWNIINKLCVQTIPQIMKKCKINNLLIIPKYNKFVIYGNRIIYYVSQYKYINNKEKEEDIKDDNYPIKILYNYYYHKFFVATLKDIRVYTSQGQLIKIYKKLIRENFDIDVKIKNFIFENNYRKIYVGYSNGAILQFNAGNGSLIKSVNEQKHNINEYINQKEISGLYFYSRPNDESLLLSTSYDGLINISYEKNPEESESLKIIKGGHSNNNKIYEILCMDFTEYLNIYATGGSDGLIILWDFEISKIIYIFSFENISYKLIIKYIKFLDPFPILAASYSDGTLYLFEIKKEIKDIDNNKCILRSRNYYKISNKINLCNIECMNIFYGVLPDIDTTEINLKIYFDENSLFIKKKEDININNNLEHYNDEIIDNELSDKYFDNINKMKYELIIGDENGNLKIINLLPLINKWKMKPLEKKEIKYPLNVYKKEEINFSTIIKYITSTIQEKNNIVLPNYYNLYYNNLIIFEKKIHFEKITYIEIIKSPLSFMTSSADNYLKIFNFKGECLGTINILPKLSKYKISDIKWNFKIDDKKIFEKEIKEVVDIYEKIGVEPIMIGSELEENIRKKIKEEIKDEKINIKKIKKKKIFSKKRFKEIMNKKEQKSELKNEENDESDEEREYNGEKFYVKSTQNQIEKFIYGGYKDNGIVEITNQLIDLTFNNKKEKMKNIKINKKPIKKILSLNDIQKIKNIKYNNSNYNKLKDEADFLSKNKKKFNSNINLENIDIKKERKSFINNKGTKFIFNSEIPSPISSQSKLSKTILPSKNEFISFSPSNNINNIKFNKIIPKLNLKKRKKLDKRFRNELLTERLFKKKISNNNDLDLSNNSRCFSFEKTMNKFNKKILSNLYGKIIFKKGETEKLLNYQFYNSAYKACCEQKKEDGIDNIPIKTNYRNNWNLVKQYTEHKKYLNTKINKKAPDKMISYLHNNNYNTSFHTEKSN